MVESTSSKAPCSVSAASVVSSRGGVPSSRVNVWPSPAETMSQRIPGGQGGEEIGGGLGDSGQRGLAGVFGVE
jgi:hypothetical protein